MGSWHLPKPSSTPQKIIRIKFDLIKFKKVTWQALPPRVVGIYQNHPLPPQKGEYFNGNGFDYRGWLAFTPPQILNLNFVLIKFIWFDRPR